MHNNPNHENAQTDRLPYDLTQIPIIALQRGGAAFLEGADKYGRGNWRHGTHDRAYQIERANHAIRHLYRYVHRLTTGENISEIKDGVPEDDLAKLFWFAVTQMELERLEAKPEMPDARDVPCVNTASIPSIYWESLGRDQQQFILAHPTMQRPLEPPRAWYLRSGPETNDLYVMDMPESDALQAFTDGYSCLKIVFPKDMTCTPDDLTPIQREYWQQQRQPGETWYRVWFNNGTAKILKRDPHNEDYRVSQVTASFMQEIMEVSHES